MHRGSTEYISSTFNTRIAHHPVNFYTIEAIYQSKKVGVMVVKPQYMVVNLSTYLEVTHLAQKKQIKAIHTSKLKVQQK